MPKLPSVSGRDLVRALEHAGFEVLRQRGSHVILVNRAACSTVVVPVHGNKDLPPGTLAGILRGADMTVDDLLRLLR